MSKTKNTLAGIKKINILRTSVILNLFLFAGSVFLAIYLFKIPKLWFFFFCIYVGNYLLTKSYLYKMDSMCYLGFLLVILGSLYLSNSFFAFADNPILIMGSFAIASLLTFCIFKQKFHLIIAIILLISMALCELYRQNFVNIYIFLSLILVNVFIFLFIYAKMKISK